MKNSLILFFLITSFSAISQSKILLSDNFKNNKKGWHLLKDSSFIVEINKGALRLEKLRKNFDDRGCLWYKKEIPGLNTLNDFSITFYAKFIKGGDHTDMIDMQWGSFDSKISSIETRIYQLNYFLKGDVKLDYFNKKWDYSLRYKSKEISSTQLYIPSEYNKYEIIQKDGFVIFKINDIQYFKQFVTPISGNYIGIQGCLKSTWEIDKIIIRQQKNKVKKGNDTLSQFTLVNEVDTNNIDKSKIKIYPNPFKNEFTVFTTSEISTNAKFELMDANGSIILQYDKKLDIGENRIRLYSDALPGIYFLKSTIHLKTTTIKLIKI